MMFAPSSTHFFRVISTKYATPATVTLGGTIAFATASFVGQTTKQTVSNYSVAAVQTHAIRRLTAAHISRQAQVPLEKTSATCGSKFATVHLWGQKCAPFSTKPSANSSGGFVAWYEGHLEARPVITKMISGSILWGLGDAVGQTVPQMMFGDDQGTGSTSLSKPYDYARTARAVFFGFAIHAPCSHLHYNFLEWMTVRGGFTGLQIPIFKAFMEQFVYWSWFSNALYHGAMGAMQNMSFQQIYDRIADVLWETQKAQWVFWIPVQLLNFRFVPVRHQLNVVLITSVAWTALLSAWYPPEEEEAKKIEEGK